MTRSHATQPRTRAADLGGHRLRARAVHPPRLRRAIAALVVAVVLSSLLGTAAGSPLAALAAFVDLVVLALAAVRLRPWWTAPALIVSAYTTLVGIGGLLVGSSLGSVGSGGITQTLDREQAAATFLLFMLASAALTVPTLLAAPLLRTDPSGPAATIPARFDRWLVVGAAVLTAACIAVLGPLWLLSRPARFGEASAAAAGASILALGLCVLLGAPVARARGPIRVAAIAIAVVIAAVFFSTASRYLCFVPPALLAGAVILGGQRRRLIPAAAAAVIGAIVLLPVPLFLRNSPTGHGLIPYLARMGRFQLTPGSFAEYANNVLISFRITGATAFQEPRIPLDALWVSLAPGSGRSVGWYDIAPTLRLNQYSPYSGLGELGNHGWAIAAGVLLAMGVVMAVLALLGTVIGRTFVGRLVATGVLAVHLLIAVQLSQYNLRTEARLLYYCLAADLAALALTVLLARLRTRRLRRAAGAR